MVLNQMVSAVTGGVESRTRPGSWSVSGCAEATLFFLLFVLPLGVLMKMSAWGVICEFFLAMLKA